MQTFTTTELKAAQLDETQAVAQVCERLEARFPDLSIRSVVSVVERAHRRFDGCPVRNYVPVLVERAARATLNKSRLVSH